MFDNEQIIYFLEATEQIELQTIRVSCRYSLR